MPRVLVDDTTFSRTHTPWQVTAARDEIRPDCEVAEDASRAGHDGSLRIRCLHATDHGGWARSVKGVRAGACYRFDAHYLARHASDESRTVVARLDWRSAAGERVGQPDYAYHTGDGGAGWTHVWALVPAPPGASQVRIELSFGWSPGGTVWWDDIRLQESEPPAARKVKIATIHHRPEGNKSAQENIEEFCAWIDRAAQSRPDIICLPEAMTAVGTGLGYAAVAEPIPGPTSRRLGEKAREHCCYLVACYNERDGAGVYNTAILIDRQGNLVGKYRKCYLPREEIEAGVTPGDECPVFETDFGKVGMMICWDVHYVEPAQRLALKGAEIILMPIWDGYETLMKARAIENHVWLVTSCYGNPSWIIDPEGKVQAEAKEGEGEGVAAAEVDLSQRPYDTEWLGDMRARFFKEHREDLR
jgi:predicted amidohydrolase